MVRAKSKRIAGESGDTATDKVLANTDLLTKILNLLPPKPLFISKAVSSHWHKVISDPQFHLNYSRRLYASLPPSTFSQFYYHSTIPISLNGCDEIIPKIDRLEGDQLYAPKDNYLVILNCCNGLILCKNRMYDWFIVSNPTTKKHRPLPGVCGSAQGDTFLAFDPLKSLNYKVVSFKRLPFGRKNLSKYYKSREDCVIDIFSSKSASWKQICLPVPSVGASISRRVFWNGAIHWISDPNFHVRLNVDEENFMWNQIPSDPNTFPEGDYIEYMGECDSGLLLIKFPRDGNYVSVGQKRTFTVLEMKKDSDCWVPKHHVIFDFLLPQVGLIDIHIYEGEMNVYECEINVLYVLSEADKDCFRLILDIDGKVILYTIDNRNNHTATKVLKEFPEDRHFTTACKFCPFVPCLAPV